MYKKFALSYYYFLFLFKKKVYQMALWNFFRLYLIPKKFKKKYEKKEIKVNKLFLYHISISFNLFNFDKIILKYIYACY